MKLSLFFHHMNIEKKNFYFYFFIVSRVILIIFLINIWEEGGYKLIWCLIAPLICLCVSSLWHVCIYTSAFVILSSTSSYPTWSSQGQPHSHYLGRHHQRLVSTMPYNYDGEDEILDPESRHNNVSLCQM
jgi:hypothetical protein